ncbi:MAG: DUF1385 domain-containing protein [Anaerolineaceae bacterium]|nr:MAG: DUF1385 domain-containing protein [Anaerolineaceae bacterium]
MKPSGIGGMAVIEGVMMKNKNEYAIAVRKPNNEITVEKKSHKDFSDKVKLFKLPIFRGMLAFIDSMVIGIKVLNFSASFFEEEEEKKEVSEKTNALLMVLAVVASLAISISLFMVLPVLISNLFSRWIESIFLLSLMEGILRLFIFIGYIVLASQMKEIKRVFMYHGAEHKTINCLENGFELTLENVKWQTKAHKRCGTSFMLLVMLISLVFFVILRPETLALRILSRILLVPVIAGISYEFIRLAGRSESKIVDILSRPGLWMQALTTKEPDDDMIEVAIASVDTVFDWKEFLKKEEDEKPKKESSGKARTVKGEKPQVSTSDLKKNSQENKKSNAKDLKESEKAQETKNVKEAKSVQEGENIQKSENIQENENIQKTGNVKMDHKAKDLGRASQHKKKDAAKNEYAVAGEISIASPKQEYEEDDEILKALDKYLDFSEDK